MGAGPWIPCAIPFLMPFAGLPPCTRRPLLKKGAIRKLFLWAGNMLFMEGRRIRYAGAVDFWVPVYGYQSPSPLWVFCAFVHGGRHPSESPWVFGDASRLHDLKRPSLFRRDKVLSRNTHRSSGFAFTHLKKFLRVPRGAFSKTHPWQGVGQRPTESEKACPTGHAFSGGTRFLHETPTDRPALPLRSEKSF